MASAPAPHSVARILYKEVVAGDLRKLLAKSNDAQTGGGARDFRFGSYTKVKRVVEQMFPQVVSKKRSRKKVLTDLPIRRGVFYWDTGAGPQHHDVDFEPPTTARPSEGRIARVHKLPSLDLARVPQVGDKDMVILLLVQLNDGSVWPHFTHQKSLATADQWDARVASEIIRCLGAARPKGTVCIGFYDFTAAGGYCNGK